MNQKQFAQITGLSEGFLSRWLSGKRKPGYKTAKRLSAQFGLPIEFWVESRPDRIRIFIDRLDIAEYDNEKYR